MYCRGKMDTQLKGQFFSMDNQQHEQRNTISIDCANQQTQSNTSAAMAQKNELITANRELVASNRDLVANNRILATSLKALQEKFQTNHLCKDLTKVLLSKKKHLFKYKIQNHVIISLHFIFSLHFTFLFQFMDIFIE